MLGSGEKRISSTDFPTCRYKQKCYYNAFEEQQKRKERNYNGLQRRGLILTRTCTYHALQLFVIITNNTSFI